MLDPFDADGCAGDVWSEWALVEGGIEAEQVWPGWAAILRFISVFDEVRVRVAEPPLSTAAYRAVP
ncbi:MAG TPA: hypothetical protein VM677_19535 [Actinokineospora sp.]|jgi:hypothetical protein|nr:hypothetical protein [Actinokineospora sp.]